MLQLHSSRHSNNNSNGGSSILQNFHLFSNAPIILFLFGVDSWWLLSTPPPTSLQCIEIRNPFSSTHPHTKWYESVGGGKGKFEWGCITGSVEKSISAIILDALRVSFHHPLYTSSSTAIHPSVYPSATADAKETSSCGYFFIALNVLYGGGGWC